MVKETDVRRARKVVRRDILKERRNVLSAPFPFNQFGVPFRRRLLFRPTCILCYTLLCDYVIYKQQMEGKGECCTQGHTECRDSGSFGQTEIE